MGQSRLIEHKTEFEMRTARIEALIAKHGSPYVYHGASPRIGTWDNDDRTRAAQPVQAAILDLGLLPNMSGSMGKPCPTTPWELAGKREDEWDPSEAEDWWIGEQTNWWHTPRPGHVYFTFNERAAYGSPTFRIDIRQLDPILVYGDEDHLRDNGLKLSGYRDGDARLNAVEGTTYEADRWYPEQGSTTFTLGQMAEMIGWGEQASELLAYEGESLSYRGSIAPDLLTLIRDYRGESV